LNIPEFFTERALTKSVSIKFWGVRGSIPCPGPETSRYGGNTSCVEVRCGDHLLIFDAGSGLRKLGEELVDSQPSQNIDLFLSHGHVDHLIGLPFFAPLFQNGRHMRIWAAGFEEIGGTRGAVSRLMSFPLFPIGVETMNGNVTFHDFRRGDALTPHKDVVIRTASLNHPGGATAYRVEYNNRAICYMTDSELDAVEPSWLALAKDADILIMDATYTNEELPQHKGWGHGSWQQVVDFADAAGVKTLCLFHHDPDHSDAVMDQIAADVAAVRAGTIVAREGLSIEV
jgi:phosphoribosyl 1,2-cyclic phosphodiesterase